MKQIVYNRDYNVHEYGIIVIKGRRTGLSLAGLDEITVLYYTFKCIEKADILIDKR
jgi:hypothetical protein